MATIAIFNPKGGVGKTSVAINLAHEAVRAGYRVLLWEVDESGDSSWLLSDAPPLPLRAEPHWIPGALDPAKLVQPTRIDRLSLIAADTRLQRTNAWFADMARGQRLAHLFASLEREHDLIILDCPPGFGDANHTVLQFANLVISPAIPAPFAMRGLERVRSFLVRRRGSHPPLLPVFSMLDRRRKTHREALLEQPGWPVIPARSEIEQMAARRRPLADYAPGSDACAAFNRLWRGIEHKLHSLRVLRVLDENRRLPGNGEPVATPFRRPAPGARTWPRFLPDTGRV